MRRAPLTLLCVSVCLWLSSEASATQNTKAAFIQAAEDGAAHSRRWRPGSGEDKGLDAGNRTLSAPEQEEQEEDRSAVRKSHAQNGTERIRVEGLLRTDGSGVRERRSGGCSPVEARGPSCSPGRRSHRHRRRRRRRSAAGGSAALAQEQDAAAPFGLNSSDYTEPEEQEEDAFPPPDFPEPTPLGPVNTRSRRRPVKNPFYPLSAEACGAYAVLIVSVVVFTVGIVGNVSVMCIVCHNYYMRSISNSLLANLALWDFIIVFFCLPLVLFHHLTKSWLLGEFSCRIVPYLEVTHTPRPLSGQQKSEVTL